MCLHPKRYRKGTFALKTHGKPTSSCAVATNCQVAVIHNIPYLLIGNPKPISLILPPSNIACHYYTHPYSINMALCLTNASALVLLSMWLLISFSEAKEYVVGGSKNSWKIPLPSPDSLNHWANTHHFKIGDTLSN